MMTERDLKTITRLYNDGLLDEKTYLKLIKHLRSDVENTGRRPEPEHQSVGGLHVLIGLISVVMSYVMFVYLFMESNNKFIELQNILNTAKTTNTIENGQSVEIESVSYEGIGAVMMKRDDVLYISRIIEDTPAADADLKAGDRIISIDETSTINMELQKAISLLRGTSGEAVDLMVMREGWQEPKPYSLIRKKISVSSSAEKKESVPQERTSKEKLTDEIFSDRLRELKQEHNVVTKSQDGLSKDIVGSYTFKGKKVKLSRSEIQINEELSIVKVKTTPISKNMWLLVSSENSISSSKILGVIEKNEHDEVVVHFEELISDYTPPSFSKDTLIFKPAIYTASYEYQSDEPPAPRYPTIPVYQTTSRKLLAQGGGKFTSYFQVSGHEWQELFLYKEQPYILTVGSSILKMPTTPGENRPISWISLGNNIMEPSMPYSISESEFFIGTNTGDLSFIFDMERPERTQKFKISDIPKGKIFSYRSKGNIRGMVKWELSDEQAKALNMSSNEGYIVPIGMTDFNNGVVDLQSKLSLKIPHHNGSDDPSGAMLFQTSEGVTLITEYKEFIGGYHIKPPHKLVKGLTTQLAYPRKNPLEAYEYYRSNLIHNGMLYGLDKKSDIETAYLLRLQRKGDVLEEEVLVTFPNSKKLRLQQVSSDFVTLTNVTQEGHEVIFVNFEQGIFRAKKSFFKIRTGPHCFRYRRAQDTLYSLCSADPLQQIYQERIEY